MTDEDKAKADLHYRGLCQRITAKLWENMAVRTMEPEKLAQESGVPIKEVRSWLAGEPTNPSMNVAFRLFDALGVEFAITLVNKSQRDAIQAQVEAQKRQASLQAFQGPAGGVSTEG